MEARYLCGAVCSLRHVLSRSGARLRYSEPRHSRVPGHTTGTATPLNPLNQLNLSSYTTIHGSCHCSRRGHSARTCRSSGIDMSTPHRSSSLGSGTALAGHTWRRIGGPSATGTRRVTRRRHSPGHPNANSSNVVAAMPTATIIFHCGERLNAFPRFSAMLPRTPLGLCSPGSNAFFPIVEGKPVDDLVLGLAPPSYAASAPVSQDF